MRINNFSTTYVPLQPPYQIIKYGKDIGMQIGTLIATTQIGDGDVQPFRIETHSYPVVTYRNKFESHSLSPFLKNSFMEGVVWNRVELRDVTTLCFSDSKMTWHQFVTLLWTDLARQGVGGTIQFGIAESLTQLGVKITPPKGKYKIHLHYIEEGGKAFVRSSQLDQLAINLLWDDDLEKMKMNIIGHIANYQMAVLAITNDVNANSEWAISFNTNEERLIPFVKLLDSLKTKDYDIISVLAKPLYKDKSLSEILEFMNALESQKYNKRP